MWSKHGVTGVGGGVSVAVGDLPSVGRSSVQLMVCALLGWRSRLPSADCECALERRWWLLLTVGARVKVVLGSKMVWVAVGVTSAAALTSCWHVWFRR